MKSYKHPTMSTSTNYPHQGGYVIDNLLNNLTYLLTYLHLCICLLPGLYKKLPVDLAKIFCKEVIQF